MKKIYGKMLLVGAAAAVCVIAGNANARVAGPCSDCHTMHNSQNGVSMQPTDADPNTPKRALTKGDCIGCHTSSTNLLIDHNTPLVVAKTQPAVNTEIGFSTLAGGNFYWVDTAANDATGHNVKNLSDPDSKIANGSVGYTPPGWSNDTMFQTNGTVAGGNASWGTTQLTCAGTYGCHGQHVAADDFQDISGAHHSDDSTIDGSTVGTSFRFLKGITGGESDDWEASTASPTSAVGKNIYKGKARTGDLAADIGADTISYLCAECHGNFHSGAGNGGVDDIFGAPWLRHPVDFDMNTVKAKEYGAYTYHMEAPPAVTNPSTMTPDINQPGQAIVTCISCHRAHGSAYDDLLRWDYAGMKAHDSAGAVGKGCFRCHTTKDA